MQKVYMFDLDGTLVDSIGPVIKGLYDFFNSFNIPCNEEIITKVISLGYDKSAEYFVKLGIPGDPKEISAKMQNDAEERYKTSIFSKPFVNEYLQNLKKNGNKLYILTASPHKLCDPCLKNNGIFELFDGVLTVGEDFLFTKSDRRLFDEVAKAIGSLPGDIHYFDDNLLAIKNAKDAGFITYGIKDLQSDNTLRQIKETAEHFIDSFEQLM